MLSRFYVLKVINKEYFFQKIKKVGKIYGFF